MIVTYFEEIIALDTEMSDIINIKFNEINKKFIFLTLIWEKIEVKIENDEDIRSVW